MTAQHERRPSPGDRSSEFLRLLAENERYTDAFDRSALTAAPLSGLAIVACMAHPTLAMADGGAR